MICLYLQGEHKNTLNKSDLKKLVKNVKKLHTIKTNIKAYNFKDIVKFYKKSLKDKESKKLLKSLKKELKSIKNYKQNLVTTHHDLNPKNILFYKNTIKFIDFEYAGVNDIFFDLATICCEFNLSEKQQKRVLLSYFKKSKRSHLKKLNSYKKIYTNLVTLWFKHQNLK